jgi:hypothetical protein
MSASLNRGEVTIKYLNFSSKAASSAFGSEIENVS